MVLSSKKNRIDLSFEGYVYTNKDKILQYYYYKDQHDKFIYTNNRKKGMCRIFVYTDKKKLWFNIRNICIYKK